MREEANFHWFLEKVRASAQELETDDPEIPRKKVPSHFEEVETPEESLSKVEEHYHQILKMAVNPNLGWGGPC